MTFAVFGAQIALGGSTIYNSTVHPAAIIPAFDTFLAGRSLRFEAVIIGGSALVLLRAAWPFVAQYEGNPESRDAYWLPLARRQLGRLATELGYDAVF